MALSISVRKDRGSDLRLAFVPCLALWQRDMDATCDLKRRIDASGDKCLHRTIRHHWSGHVLINDRLMRMPGGMLPAEGVNASSGCVGTRHTAQRSILLIGLYL